MKARTRSRKELSMFGMFFGAMIMIIGLVLCIGSKDTPSTGQKRLNDQKMLMLNIGIAVIILGAIVTGYKAYKYAVSELNPLNNITKGWND